MSTAAILHVEYADRGKSYGILFMFSLFCEHIHLEYVRIHAIYRVNPAEYVYSYSCGCATGICEYRFNTQDCHHHYHHCERAIYVVASQVETKGLAGGICCNLRVCHYNKTVTSKGFALTWYRALTWYSSPARPFAAPDVPLLITRQHGSPPPRVSTSSPGLQMRAQRAHTKKVPS